MKNHRKFYFPLSTRSLAIFFVSGGRHRRGKWKKFVKLGGKMRNLKIFFMSKFFFMKKVKFFSDFLAVFTENENFLLLGERMSARGSVRHEKVKNKKIRIFLWLKRCLKANIREKWEKMRNLRRKSLVGVCWFEIAYK